MTIIYSDERAVSLNCNDDKIEEIASKIIDNYDSVFTFTQFCKAVVKEADDQNLLKKEAHTEYCGGVRFDGNTTHILHKYIWEKIWKHEIVIDLVNNQYEYVPDKGVKLRKI